MPELYKYLKTGLQNIEDCQDFVITVRVISHLCDALNDKILPYSDGILCLLMHSLQNDDLHQSLKPCVFSCIGDIAIAIGQHFSPYFVPVITMLQTAAHICGRREILMNHNELKRGVLEAYSGIVQGLKESKTELMLPHAAHLLQFVEWSLGDTKRDKCVRKAAVVVMGDLADALGSKSKMLFRANKFWARVIEECLESDDEQLRMIASWTRELITRVMVSSNTGTFTLKTQVKERQHAIR